MRLTHTFVILALTLHAVAALPADIAPQSIVERSQQDASSGTYHSRSTADEEEDNAEASRRDGELGEAAASWQTQRDMWSRGLDPIEEENEERERRDLSELTLDLEDHDDLQRRNKHGKKHGKKLARLGGGVGDLPPGAGAGLGEAMGMGAGPAARSLDSDVESREVYDGQDDAEIERRLRKMFKKHRRKRMMKTGVKAVGGIAAVGASTALDPSMLMPEADVGMLRRAMTEAAVADHLDERSLNFIDDDGDELAERDFVDELDAGNEFDRRGFLKKWRRKRFVKKNKGKIATGIGGAALVTGGAVGLARLHQQQNSVGDPSLDPAAMDPTAMDPNMVARSFADVYEDRDLSDEDVSDFNERDWSDEDVSDFDERSLDGSDVEGNDLEGRGWGHSSGHRSGSLSPKSSLGSLRSKSPLSSFKSMSSLHSLKSMVPFRKKKTFMQKHGKKVAGVGGLLALGGTAAAVAKMRSDAAANSGEAAPPAPAPAEVQAEDPSMVAQRSFEDEEDSYDARDFLDDMDERDLAEAEKEGILVFF